MQLINPAIIYGLGLAAVPVLLHMLLRARPKPHLFPALLLLEQRRRHNRRRLRLRHIWLLLLRIALIALLVLAVARPKLPAADYWPQWPAEVLGLLAVFVIPWIIYRVVIHRWRRRDWPDHRLSTQRSLLRGGLGVLVVLLLGLWAGAWYGPRVGAEVTNPSLGAARNAPVAAVFIFDTSQSMEYRHQSKTRLEVAQEIAREHLDRLPAGSQVAVIDTSVELTGGFRAADDTVPGVDEADKAGSNAPAGRFVLFQSSPIALRRRIDQLSLHPVARTLNGCIEGGLSLLESNREREMVGSAGEDGFVREVYVFTDLARGAWSRGTADAGRLSRAVESCPWLGGIYIVDTGVSDPVNSGIASLDLSRQTVAEGGAVTITATVDGTGLSGEVDRTVDLLVVNASGKPVPRGSAAVKLKVGAASTISLVADGLSGPFVQGELRLRSSDPLASDDVAYFTVAVASAPRVLVVAPTSREAAYLIEALSPRQEVERGRARFRCDHVPPNRLADASLSDYRTVILLNVSEVPDDSWSQLERFVESGGGLGVVLGSSVHWQQQRGVKPSSYNSDAAQAVLPASLDVSRKFTPPEYLDLRNATHPALKLFADLGGAGDLVLRDVRLYWRLQPGPGSQVVSRFTGDSRDPALLERSLGRGRTLMLATALDLRWGWNDLPRSDWFVVLVDQLVGYLAQRSGESYTYEANTALAVQLFPSRLVTEFSVVAPDGGQRPGRSRSGRVLTVDVSEELGHYQVRGLGDAVDWGTGFSLNLDAAERDLSRLAGDDLDLLLGADRYQVARDLEELERRVGDMRIGREVFPMLLVLLLIVFCCEHLVANRFYETGRPAAAPGGGDTVAASGGGS